jgi:cell fate regulator YaaT (PSP1 superfamily)
MIVVGVVFQSGGKVETLDPNGSELQWNDRVICETARGEEYGRVVQAAFTLEGKAPERIFRVLRKATPADDALRREQRERAAEVRRVFRREVVKRHQGIKVHGAEMPFDGRRVVIGYTSEERVDLRPIAQDVGRQLNLRVEARQVGPRDGARVTGGYGLCGDVLCCTRYPAHETRITLRMAKDQELPVNPGRVTGLCGRLRCCLAFEHPVYKSFRDRAPAVGRTVETPEGRGVVRGSMTFARWSGECESGRTRSVGCRTVPVHYLGGLTWALSQLA